MKIDPSRYAPENLERLGVKFDPTELMRIVSLDTIEAVLENAPAKRFAEVMKLPRHEWLSVDHVDRDIREGDGEWRGRPSRRMRPAARSLAPATVRGRGA